jgi:hypothetical protein
MSFKIFASLSSAALLAACNVTDPEVHNEEELITSIRLVYTQPGGASDTAWFKDPDGPGGAAPTRHDTLELQADRTFEASLTLLDESDAADVHDITEEVEEEAADHQVFYAVAGANLATAYADHDANGLPIGLKTTQTTGGASTGSLTVTLKHQPGLKSAASTVNTGETDVQVVFPVVIR